jgi:hypothetical protein
MNIVVYDLNKNNDDRLKLINPLAPKPPMRVVLCGHSGSGKTQIIFNFLKRNDIGYNKYFDLIFIFCGSLDDYENYETLTKSCKLDLYNKKGKKMKKHITLFDKSVIRQNTTINEMNELIHTLEHNEEFRDKRVLFVLDDMIVSSLLKNNNVVSPIDTLMVRGRHIAKGISTIISTQKYTLLKQNIRMINATHLFLFNGLPSHQMKLISSEVSGAYDEKEFINIYNKYAGKKYTFILINLKEDKSRYIQDNHFNYITPHQNIE